MPATPQPSWRCLSPGERSRRTGFRDPGALARYTTAAVLLRLCVSHYTGQAPGQVRIERTCPDCDRPHGRPVVAGSRLHVSITHAGDRVGVAVTATGPVGLDVEGVDPAGHLPRMDRHVFSEAESESPGGAEKFYRCWARKESVLKATGDGLRVPMATLELTGDPPTLTAFPSRPELVGRAVLRDVNPGAGYVGAVTVLSPDPVEFLEFDGETLARARRSDS